MKCTVLPERTIRLGTNKVLHVMPECHVQSYTKEEHQEIEREQQHLRGNWSRAYSFEEYGRFRIDLIKRMLGVYPLAERYWFVATYLASEQVNWPEYDLTNEIKYYSNLAQGIRSCEHCGETMRPIPACDCGCQKPPKDVPGWSTMGGAVKAAPGAPGEFAAMAESPF